MLVDSFSLLIFFTSSIAFICIYILIQKLFYDQRLTSQVHKVVTLHENHSSNKYSEFVKKRESLVDEYIRLQKKKHASNPLIYNLVSQSQFSTLQIVLYFLALYIVSNILLYFHAQLPLLKALGLALLVSLMLIYFILSLQAKNFRKNLIEELPHVLDIITRRLKTGGSLYEAIQSVSENWEGTWQKEFRKVLNQINAGSSLDVALRQSSKSMNLDDYQFFCAIIIIQQKRGGKLVEILSEFSEILRSNQAISRKTAVLASQSVASARFISIAPLVLLSIILYNKPDTVTYMLHTTTGQKLLAFGGGLYSFGLILMSYLTRIKV